MTSCFTCGWTGHESKNCLTSPKKIAFCSDCKLPGHSNFMCLNHSYSSRKMTDDPNFRQMKCITCREFCGKINCWEYKSMLNLDIITKNWDDTSSDEEFDCELESQPNFFNINWAEDPYEISRQIKCVNCGSSSHKVQLCDARKNDHYYKFFRRQELWNWTPNNYWAHSDWKWLTEQSPRLRPWEEQPEILLAPAMNDLFNGIDI